MIHYQSPQSVIHYYQQVGRAGRRLNDSYGILLKGTEDDDINNYFIESAFPSEEDTRLVLGHIEERGHWVTRNEILSEINISPRSLEKVLLHLEIQQAIEKRVGEYRRTLNPWNYDALTVEEITSIRRAEVTEMKDYIETDECRNAFLLRALDDPNPAECGICQNCTGRDLDLIKDHVEIERAQSFVRSDYGIISPRLQEVPPELRSSEGRVLSRWGVGIGSTVRSDREAGFYSEELLEFSERLIWDTWAPHPFPAWITVVPSNRYPGVMENFASRLAERLAINFLTAITKIESRPPQRNMQNTVQQRRNVQGCFQIQNFEAGPVLLLDDIVDSRWTLTQIGMQLREAGVEKVYPFALADTSGSSVHD